MYIYISIYISVIIAKLFLEYDNDHRLETYRASCKGTKKMHGSKITIEKYLV